MYPARSRAYGWAESGTTWTHRLDPKAAPRWRSRMSRGSGLNSERALSQLPLLKRAPNRSLWVGNRRERLKARLKAAREDPRPEPLPPTVAEAGVLAVERISTLQTELAKMKALNLTLTQDLEGARRQAEKATEEARLRMDEARRLASEMDARVALLSEMEKELASLEAERDEALLALQEARQTIETASHEREELKGEIAKREQA